MRGSGAGAPHPRPRTMQRAGSGGHDVAHATTDRGLRADQRLPVGRAGRPRRQHRLAVLPPVRLREHVRGAARRRVARAMAARPVGPGRDLDAPLHREHLHARHHLDDEHRGRRGHRLHAARQPLGRHRAAGARRQRLGRAGAGRADPLRLRTGGALGAAGPRRAGTRHHRDRGARRRHRAGTEPARAGPVAPGRVHRARGRDDRRRPQLVPLVPRRPASARRRPPDGVDQGVVGRVDQRYRSPGPLPRRGGPVPDRAARPHARGHGRHRGRGDHEPPRALRRRS